MIDDGPQGVGRLAVDEGFFAALLEDDARELYESAPCGYLSLLPDGAIVKANRTFLLWSGYTAEDLVARRRFQELLPVGDRIFYEAHVAPLLRLQDQAREIAIEVVTRTGERRPALMSAVLVRDADGEPSVVRVAVFDASERRSYEQELLAARQRAEASEARALALAHTLQLSFLPPELASVPSLDVGGSYRPAGDGSEVGGDFYDVFDTRDAWAIVLGDVCGKGASAAVLTTLARYTLRAAALRVDAPSAVLAELHEAFLRYHPDQFCTALYLSVGAAEAGHVPVTVASGGHQLPLCRRAGGRFEPLGATGSIVGLVARSSTTDVPAVLAPGDVLVAYTDGVTEARRGTELFGEARLRDAIADGAHLGAQALADHIVDVALAFQDGDARDDIAVVALAVAP